MSGLELSCFGASAANTYRTPRHLAIAPPRRVPKGTVDAALSYCHDNLADDTLQGLVPYLREKGVKVVSASFSSMGLLTQKVSARSLRTAAK